MRIFLAIFCFLLFAESTDLAFLLHLQKVQDTSLITENDESSEESPAPETDHQKSEKNFHPDDYCFAFYAAIKKNYSQMQSLFLPGDYSSIFSPPPEV